MPTPLDLVSRLSGLGDFDTLTCLDLGCGHCASPISEQVLKLRWQRLISVDLYQPYLDKLSAKPCKATTWQIFCDDMAKVVLYLWTGVDVVLLLDTLEHLEKDEALQFLRDIERVNPKRILVWLPLNICPQGEYNGNDWQEHLSTWSAEELVTLGFKVEVFPEFHKHFSPPVDAAWAVKDIRLD